MRKLPILVIGFLFFATASLHPINAQEEEASFIPVNDLKIGDWVFIKGDEENLVPEKITKHEWVEGPIEVYNLTVEGDKTFFANSFAVHNKGEHADPRCGVEIEPTVGSMTWSAGEVAACTPGSSGSWNLPSFSVTPGKIYEIRTLGTEWHNYGERRGFMCQSDWYWGTCSEPYYRVDTDRGVKPVVNYAGCWDGQRGAITTRTYVATKDTMTITVGCQELYDPVEDPNKCGWTEDSAATIDWVEVREIGGAGSAASQNVSFRLGIWAEAGMGARKIQNPDGSWPDWSWFGWNDSGQTLSAPLSSGKINVKVMDYDDQEGECSNAPTPTPDCSVNINGPWGGYCTNITSNSYTDVWGAPGGTFDKQVIRVSTDKNCVLQGCPVGCNCVVKADLGKTATSYPVSGLAPSTLYWNRVAAVCTNPDGGIGWKDNTWSCTTPATPTGTIQGFKVLMPNNQNLEPAKSQTVRLDGGSPTTTNPYSFTSVSATNHTVSVSIPASYSVVSTLCYNQTNCHSDSCATGGSCPVAGAYQAGNSRTVNVPSGGYVDLWWHYTPTPSAPTCTISGSTPVTINTTTTYCATTTNAPNGVEIWKSPTTSQSWTNVRPKGVDGCSQTSFSQTGTYYLVCNAYGSGVQCSGNPWCPWPPVALPESACSGWNDCTANDVLVVNVTPPGPWFQTQGGDVHGETGIRSKIPTTATNKNFCTDLDNYPGVVSHTGTADFSPGGTASSRGWLANSSYTPDYNYNYFYQKLDSPTEDNFKDSNGRRYCDEVACPTPAGTTIYYVDGNLNIQDNSSWVVPNNSKIVVLVNGNLNINLPGNRRITVAQGGFLGLIVKGNINIDGNIGDKQVAVTPYLEGVYLADGIIDTYEPDPVGEGSGFRLVGAGLFYAKAGFALERDLKDDCSDPLKVCNARNPAELFIFRPDLVLNAPPELWVSKMSWLEVAP